jgi:transposase
MLSGSNLNALEVQRRPAMKHASSKEKGKKEEMFVGIDLGDKQSHYCILNQGGKVVDRGEVATTQTGLRRKFARRGVLRIALEVGTHSCWSSRLLKGWGHSVLVANTRELKKISENQRKTDRNDAEILARLLRADPKLLSAVEHGSLEKQQDLAVLRARDALVGTRTKLINTVRGLMKSLGYRLVKCSAESFVKKAKPKVPPELRGALAALLETIEHLNEQLRGYDRQVESLAEKKYPETAVLRQVQGVGPITATAFVLRLGEKQRFRKSREVGPYLGLVPRRDQSGESDRQLPITKAGDKMLRRLLVSSAHYILGPFGADCHLRRKGLALAERGGKNAKKRAVVAIARRLAVLLHHLWVSGEVYQPFYQAHRAAVA